VRRVVLDANVLVAAFIRASGAAAQLVDQLGKGSFELVLCPHLLDELHGVLLREKFRRYVSDDEVEAFVQLLRNLGVVLDDPDPIPPLSPDPDDDYLLALAAQERCALVSGDRHLLGLAGDLPIFSPREYLSLLEP
jgi:putative PIN family toxin of toxin-antitoxin system